jgi:hypothetical protein
MKFLYSLLALVLLGTFLNGCGGSNGTPKDSYTNDNSQNKEDGNSAKDKQKTKTIVGYVVDSPIWGLEYSCQGQKTKLTDKNGKFECEELPVTFKVGDLTIGHLSQMNDDLKVYPQDIIGVSRDKVDDEDVLTLTRFFQTLDDDGIYEDTIKIDPKSLKSFKFKKSLKFSDLDQQSISSMLKDKVNKELISKDVAKTHLNRNLINGKKPTGIELSLNSTTISQGLEGEAITKGIYDVGDGDVKSILSKNVTYKSSNPKIATIDKDGKIKALMEGDVDIIATYKNFTSKASLKVTHTILTKIDIKDPTLAQLNDLAIGRSARFKVDGYYSSDDLVKDVSSQIVWSSKSPFFNNIELDSGYVRTSQLGNTSLLATLFDLTDEIDFEIKKSDIKSIKIYPSGSIKVPKGKSIHAVLLGIYEDDSNTTMDDMNRSLSDVATWSVDDNETLVYTEDGNLTPNNYYIPSYSNTTIYVDSSKYDNIYDKDINHYRYRGLIANKEGKATLSVKYKDFEDSVNIEIVKAVVDEIDLIIAKHNIKANESIQANVRAIYSDGKVDDNFTSKVVLESLNPAILTISNDGNITAIKGGHATIKATFITPDRNITTNQYISVDFKPVDIEISSSKDSININHSQYLYVDLINENGDKNRIFSNDIEWSIDKKDIARLNIYGSDAEIGGLKEGEFTLTVKYGEFSTTKTFKVVGPTSIEIDYDGKESIHIGNSKSIYVNAVYSDKDKNRIYSDDIEWSIDKQDIARLNIYGSDANIRGLKDGEVKLTAKMGKLTATKTFKVVGPTSIEITTSKDEIPLGKSIDLSVKSLYDDGSDGSLNYGDIVWSIESGSENAKLNVSYNANLTTTKKGEVTIKATYGDLSTTKTFKIVDPIFESISIEPNYETVYIGKEKEFKLMARYSDGTKKELSNSVTWKMLSNIATVDDKGVVKGVMEGNSRLKATYQDQTTSTDIRVDSLKVTSLTSSSGEYGKKLNLGESYTIKVKANYNDGSKKEITDNLIFKSSDESVATVDSNGVVKALKNGSTMIYVEYSGDDKSDSYMSGMFMVDIFVDETPN